MSQELKVIETINGDIDRFLEQGYHMIGNNFLIKEVPKDHKPSYEVVSISTDKETKETYPQKGGGFSITAVGLAKLANAANIRFQPGKILPPSGPNCVRYSVSAQCLGLDGSPRRVTKEHETDLDVRSDELELAELERGMDELAKDPKDRHPDFKMTTEDQVRRWAKDKARFGMIEVRKHKLTKTETSAQNRCIRSLLQLKPSYSTQELAKPFLLLKMVFVPDGANPVDRKYLLDAHFGASDSMYPPDSQGQSFDVQKPQERTLVSIPYPEESIQEEPGFVAPDPTFHDIPATATTNAHLDEIDNDDPDPAVENAVLDFFSMEVPEQCDCIRQLVIRKNIAMTFSTKLEHQSTKERADIFRKLNLYQKK